VRFGLDSYAYHRYLGELRPGEVRPAERWSDPIADPADAARRLGLGAVSLQTCFAGRAADVAIERLRAAGRQLEVVPAWGAPEGLRYGADDDALADLLDWIGLAAASGCTLLRIVLGGPRLRGQPFPERLARALEPLARAGDAARTAGVRLAIENHGEIRADELTRILERSGDAGLGVCFDTANALRVGDHVVEAAQLLAPRVAMVHLKDVEPVARERHAQTGPCSVPYGTGVIPLDATLDALAAGGFDGPVFLELGQIAPGDDEHALIDSGLAWLDARGLGPRAQPVSA
jgi:sugar phosphate isomerase/epimerase